LKVPFQTPGCGVDAILPIMSVPTFTCILLGVLSVLTKPVLLYVIVVLIVLAEPSLRLNVASGTTLMQA
jgi:hypothetical protein